MAEEFDILQDETPPQEADFTEDLPLPEGYADEATQKPLLTRKQKIVLVSIGAGIVITIIGLISGLVLFSGRND